jgi:hypothetical protein
MTGQPRLVRELDVSDVDEFRDVIEDDYVDELLMVRFR